MFISKLEKEFLKESNAIEGVYDNDSLQHAEIAWEAAKKIKGDLAVVDVLHLHYLLMEQLNPRIAGKFRKVAVRIGTSIKKVESEAVLTNKVSNVLDCINSAKKPTKKEASSTESKQVRFEQAKEDHIAFENIHPFEDGNGRVGRILYNLHRLRLGLPIDVIHEGEEQYKYYKWFHE